MNARPGSQDSGAFFFDPTPGPSPFGEGWHCASLVLLGHLGHINGYFPQNRKYAPKSRPSQPLAKVQLIPKCEAQCHSPPRRGRGWGWGQTASKCTDFTARPDGSFKFWNDLSQASASGVEHATDFTEGTQAAAASDGKWLLKMER